MRKVGFGAALFAVGAIAFAFQSASVAHAFSKTYQPMVQPDSSQLYQSTVSNCASCGFAVPKGVNFEVIGVHAAAGVAACKNIHVSAGSVQPSFTVQPGPGPFILPGGSVVTLAGTPGCELVITAVYAAGPVLPL
jgi:hypothetical protein